MVVPKSILVVEDEPLVLLFLEDVLLGYGYRVHVAHDGPQAADALPSGEAFDLLVTDIRMPGLNGWAVARRARILFPEIPVIYMTGDSEARHSSEGVAGSTLLPKPFSADKFIKAVTKCLAPET